jgi:hypothetical protein
VDNIHALFLILEGLLLVLEEDVYSCQPAADAESQHKNDKVVDNDTLGVGLARLAVVLRIAVLAFDMTHHSRSDGAAPPCIFDGLGVGLSALRTGGVLSWVLHEVSSER